MCQTEAREDPNAVKPEAFQQQRDGCDLKEEWGNRLEEKTGRGEDNSIISLPF